MSAIALQFCAMAVEEPRRVVRRGDGGMSEERLTWHLENWAHWQQLGEVTYGAPSRAGSGMGLTHRTTFDDMVAAADTTCAEAVEAVLDGLSPIERFAVHHEHLAAVYRFPHHRASHAEIYARARVKLRQGLSNRGVL